MTTSAREGGARVEAAGGWTPGRLLLLYAVFALLVLAVYGRALQGAFISDDVGYFQSNPFTQTLTLDNVIAIVDPRGAAKFHTANYAPVHLLAHAVEWHLFGEETLGYHVVNVLDHALVSVLLVALLSASGVPAAAALLGGAIFAVHPANVEAVAWISQLKTNGALALSLGALLAQRRHPPLAATLFALALLTKASAAFALPMAAALTWMRRGRAGGERHQWAWLVGWLVILVLYAIPQFQSFGHVGGVHVPEYQDPWVQLRTIAAVGMRYLVMAATSYGVSAFQEPPLALSLDDPWWLCSLPVTALLAWRLMVSWRRGSEEFAWWIGAAAAFVPVSQLFPFLHPTADRYLYFILPGLLGGSLLWVTSRLRAHPPSTAGTLGLVIGSTALVLLFAVRSAERAKLWRNETMLLVDAASHYPAGETAAFLRARSAAQAGDRDGAIAVLRELVDGGFDQFSLLVNDPGLAPLRRDDEFVELVRAVAARWIAVAEARGFATQAELRMKAHAYIVREEYPEAREALQEALDAGGPLEPAIRKELEAVDTALSLLERRQRERDTEGGDDRPQQP